MGRVFANGAGDWGSIPGRVIPKTLNMVLDISLLNTQQYKVRIKSKVKQSRERSSAPLHLGVVAIEKGAFWSSPTKGRQLYFILMYLSKYRYPSVQIYLSIYLSIYQSFQMSWASPRKKNNSWTFLLPEHIITSYKTTKSELVFKFYNILG